MKVGEVGIFVAATLILLFFLLASERWLISRTVEAMPRRRSRVAVIGAVRAAQRDIATFLATQALINAGVAMATGLACWMIGLPNPVLWGAFAGIMSFIPYLGPMVVLVTLFLAGALTFETAGEMLLPPAGVRRDQPDRKQLRHAVGCRSPPRAESAGGVPGGDVRRVDVGNRRCLHCGAVPSRSAQCRASIEVAARLGGYLDRGREEPASLRYLLGLRRRRRAHAAVSRAPTRRGPSNEAVSPMGGMKPWPSSGHGLLAAVLVRVAHAVRRLVIP